MKSLSAYPVKGVICVVENGAELHDGNFHVIRLGTEIGIETKLLDAYCFSSPTDLTYDLMSVIGAVKYADRSIRRCHGEGWGRAISVEIPVLEESLWSSQQVTADLEDCLSYLTGDEWRFTFRRRKKRPLHPEQSIAPLVSSQAYVFVPYSHGLDSYAQVRLLKEREPGTEIVCVFTASKPDSKTWKEFCRSKPRGDMKPIQVPVVVSEPHHAELTFRSRPFTYYLLSAYGAVLNGSNRVLIPENGQGSLGGSLVPLGNEAQHRSCHPGFTTRLSKLLERLSGEKVNFEHPALFKTKGQVLTELAAVDPNSDTWLLEHRSCSHDQRHANHNGVRVHCGACGNCILRRASAQIAKINDVTKYKFSDSRALSLETAILDGGAAPHAMKSFLDLAGNSIRSMERMAVLANEPENAQIWAEAASLANYMAKDVKTLHTQIVSLLGKHQNEWKAFLQECGEDSWIAHMAKG
ncbi:MAG: hypothetical protein JWR22_3126 [Herminiimonas sp.]|nr:hypothetical protein [Herminiimonas sp.]